VDIENLPEEIRSGIEIKLAEDMKEVIDSVLVKASE